MDEFIEWYCSGPRLSLNKIVVLRYRIYLESRKLAPGTVNLRLGAVRRLAYEAAAVRDARHVPFIVTCPLLLMPEAVL
jgi:hypothetical protein